MTPRRLPGSHAGTAGKPQDVGGASVLIGHRCARAAALVVLALALFYPGAARAAVSAFWQELGGSANASGVSQVTTPSAIFDVSAAVGADGLPVVAYTEYPDATSTQGLITVKRWNATTMSWNTLGANTEIGIGYVPQVRVSTASTPKIFVAWLVDNVDGTSEVHLREWTGTGTTWVEVGTSDSPGGVSGANPGIAIPFSLALDGDTPYVAFTGAAQTGLVDVTATPQIVDGTIQVYVRRWNGAAWEFVGSDFGLTSGGTGDGSGASNATSFTATAGTILHDAGAPALVIDDSGAPVVAFTYATEIDGAPATNTDIYATRWDGTAWVAVGPAVPADGNATGAGGAAAGISNSAGASSNPALAAAGAGGRLALTWEEDPGDGSIAVWVREWNGVDTWQELAGSATGSGFTAPGTTNIAPQVGVDASGNPIVAWQGLLDPASPWQIFVRQWNGTDTWIELGVDSASNAGISDAALDAFAPALAVTPASATPAGVPSVAWIDVRDPGPSQVFLRQYFAGATVPLSVTVSGDGSVSTNPLGLTCAAGTCEADFPRGTPVTLLAQANALAGFVGWADACAARRANASCTVTLATNTSVTATFAPFVTLTAQVSAGGHVDSAPAGISACGDSCRARFAPGTLVTLTATRDSATGVFSGWGGACGFRRTNASCTLTLSADTTVSAGFKRFRLNVAVAAPGGTFGQGTLGSVSGSDIDCTGGGVGGVCATDVGLGEPVVLRATPQPGNRFLNWSGGPCGGRTNATCPFAMSANTTTTALFRGVTGVAVGKSGNGGGTITGPGLACGTDCFQEMFTGTRVTLTATPAAGSVFGGWSGACAGPTCTFTVSGDNRSITVTNQSVTATFTLRRQHLNVAATGAGFVAGDVGGIDCGGGHVACGQDYDYGTLVRITPVPAVDAMLAAWTGCTRLDGTVCVAAMTANLAVKATFVPARTLSIAASGNGSGRITANTTPALICLSNCSVSQLVRANVSVTLTPQPATGTNFHWLDGGDCLAGSTASCSVTMSQNRSAVGQFTLNRHRLTVLVPKLNGSVTSTLPGGATLDCTSDGSACTGIFDYGTSVVLQATSNVGFAFAGWTGVTCAGGAANSRCPFTLKGNTTVTASWRPRTTVTIVKQGNGAGTVSGPGLICGPSCATASAPEYDLRVVSLAATPATGSHFTGFSGDCTSAASTCAFVPSGDNQSVAASFTLNRHSLTVKPKTIGGNGSVVNVFDLPEAVAYDCGSDGGNCTGVFDYGTPITLRAVPDPGSIFTGWSGVTCLVGGATNASCSFLLRGNTTVTPSYRRRTLVVVTKTGNGDGQVTAPGIVCSPTTCSTAQAFEYDGKPITISTAPAEGSFVAGYSGGCVSSTPTCTFTPTGDSQNVSVSLRLVPIGIGVTIVGPGTVTGLRLPGADPCSAPGCRLVVDYGTKVELHLTAVPGTAPSPTSEFVSWTGCTTKSTNESCTLAMPAGVTANTSVTAIFQATVDSLMIVPLAIDGTTPILKGTKRQYAAVGVFSDGSQQDVTAQATTRWSSNASTVVSISSRGLASGLGLGSANVSVSFSTKHSAANASVVVKVDVLQPGSLAVSCAPYGDPGGALTCLPAGLGFQVECQALGTFATLPPGSQQDVTDQVTWSSTSTAARSLGFSRLNGSTYRAFSVDSVGTARVTATGSGTSGFASVQSVPVTVTGLTITNAPTGPLTVGTPVQLAAMASFNSGASCVPPPRDVSLLTSWSSEQPAVATVNFLGQVTPVAPGATGIDYTYRTFTGRVPITVGP